MAPINMKRYDTSMHEIPPAPYTQPSGRTLQQHTGSLSRYHSTVPHPSFISDDPQTFPILPGQLEKRLGQVRQRLICDIPVQATPAGGSAPSPSSDNVLVLNPPAEMVPTAYAFHASTLGMPSVAEYLRFFTRYLDEMTPNKRRKALIDLELLRRIKLILTFQSKRFSGSGETSSEFDSAPPTPYSTGESWDTQPFRRWVRNTFVYRPATRAELERAIDFGLLSPPESSLSGPGVPGHPPSAGLARSMDLVFHHDRPVALRSRIYKIILRAHWITNHSGRDRTWAMVREACSYIPKCLVYDFVAACPTCRVARSKQYGMYNGIPRVISAAEVEKPDGMLQDGFQNKGGKGDLNARGGLPLILPASSHDTSPVGWIPQIFPYDHTQIPEHLLLLLNRHEIDAQIVADPTSDLPFGSIRQPPLPNLLPPVTSVQCQTIDRSQQSNFRSRGFRETQQEAPALGRERCPTRTVISRLMEAGSNQAEDISVWAGSLGLKRKDGPSAPEESIEPAGPNVGHETMTWAIPPWEAHRGDEDASMEID